jgi:antibiotic biosynthesis monooxygenase (ABM) superfamily enzyme
MPTVVVSRTVSAGREREFERWLRRLVSAAERAPGHVSADVQPPTDAHPDEWVVVYRFDSAAHLHGWLESPERAAFIESGRGLIEGAAREQVLALGHGHDPVTAVASFRVKAGNAERYLEFHTKLVDCLSAFPGFIRSELFEPVPGVQDDTAVVFSFDTRAHLDAWLESDRRRLLLSEIDEYLEGGRTVNVVGGFGGWFGRPGMVSVKRWKQASVVLLALFPTTLVLTKLRQELLPDVGFAPGILLGNAVGVTIMSWVLMPVLTKMLAGWLSR